MKPAILLALVTTTSVQGECETSVLQYCRKLHTHSRRVDYSRFETGCLSIVRNGFCSQVIVQDMESEVVVKADLERMPGPLHRFAPGHCIALRIVPNTQMVRVSLHTMTGYV